MSNYKILYHIFLAITLSMGKCLISLPKKMYEDKQELFLTFPGIFSKISLLPEQIIIIISQSILPA